VAWYKNCKIAFDGYDHCPKPAAEVIRGIFTSVNCGW